MQARSRAIIILILLTLAACAPTPSVSTQAPSEGTTQGTTPRPGRTVVMAIVNEPDALTSATGLSSNISTPIRLFNAGVALKDERGVASPYLVEDLPQLNTDSWKVFPDGRMETTYRLKSNLSWHDGTTLAADDFVFGWRVFTTPAYGVSGRPPQSQMDEVLAPDPRTVVVSWNRPFPDAATLMTGGDFDFTPLPRHLLDGAFQEDRPESFTNHSYWTRDYVGLGPFRLERWEPGAFLEGGAFEAHALGRPKIDHIRVVFIRDPNTAVSSLLAGEVHVTDDTVLTFSQGTFLRQEWSARAGGTVLYAPNLLSYAAIQSRPEVVSPRALLDPRVRSAVASAIDKEGLNEGLFEGQGLSADSLLVPQVDYYPALERAITKYRYDPRRTEQLMLEAGFTRGSDGFFTHPTEGLFTPELRYADLGEYAKGAPIIQDGWRRAGIDSELFVYSSTFLRDGQYRAGYPAFDYTGAGVDESNAIHSLSSKLIPTPETRWTGQNRGGWSHAEYDRLVDLYDTTLDRSQRNQQVVDMMRIVSDEVPWIPFYFNLRVIAYTAALSGPQSAVPGGTRAGNVHEWDSM